METKSNQTIQAIVLAAGASRRFNTTLPKLCTPLCGKPLIFHPLMLLVKQNMPITCIIGHQSDLVRKTIEQAAKELEITAPVTFVEQKEQRGTGHAVLCSQSAWQAEHLLILSGDTPLFMPDSLHRLIEEHLTHQNVITFACCPNASPESDGMARVVREPGRLHTIEARHDNLHERTNQDLLNAGIYLFKRSFLETFLPKLKPNPESSEVYLPELIELASTHQLRVSYFTVPFSEARGVNTLEELAEAEQSLRAKVTKQLQLSGVRLLNPHSSSIDLDVRLESGVCIDQGCILRGRTSINSGTTVGAYSVITNSVIGKNVTIHPHSVITDTVIMDHAIIGPFAHVHGESILCDRATVGNFVEVNRSVIGSHSKAKHLSYLGDAIIGKQSNIGAGTIVCNYDGHAKHKTNIGDNVAIGSLNALVAPITIGDNAITAAGSVITDTVPADAFAIAREKQTTKEGYAPLLKERIKQRAKTAKEEMTHDSSDTHGGPTLRNGKLRRNRPKDGDSPASA